MSVRTGNLLYTSGHLPISLEGDLTTGKVGYDVTLFRWERASLRTWLIVHAERRVSEHGSSSNARYVRIHTYPGIEQKQYVRQQELGV